MSHPGVTILESAVGLEGGAGSGVEGGVESGADRRPTLVPRTDEADGRIGERLAAIHDPSALRSMSTEALRTVADELRDYLIALGARNGGHFAGSLGAVELTVALHAVFETPDDKLIWDVGHQAWGHKALTGRLHELARIKTEGGPAGFLRRSESEYDAFGAGHAGTSISAALGMAHSFVRAGSKQKAVAIIGDGGATSGMAFEALNHAGEIESPVRIVYNDNGMSIAPTVGGLSRTGAIEALARSLHLDFLGPVDGHDLEALLPMMRALHAAQRPTLLHVYTRKGEGFAPATADPYRWHATPPFDPRSGARGAASKPTQVSWTQAFQSALIERAEQDDRVLAITAAMPDGTGLDGFAERFRDRFLDVGIAEQHAVTFAAGLAAEGLRPVCAIYSTFLQRAFDQLVHDVALQSLPVTFALDRAGLVGGDGPTHHGALDLAYLRIVPNLVVAAPRNDVELRRLLATAIEWGGPFALRYPRGPAVHASREEAIEPLPVGRGEVLREGDDVALLTLGKGVGAALEAADGLAARGVSARVVDARFAKPLDADLIASAATECGAVLTLEDHVLAGGFGSAVLELLAERAPLARVACIGLSDRFVEHGSVEAQWRAEGMAPESIIARALALLERCHR